MISKITSLFLLVLLMNCSRSVVYSPSVHLTNQPLKERELDLRGGVELMPEARAESLGGSPVTLGVNGQISYGFSDTFNLGVSAWADVEGRESLVRSGYALQAQFWRYSGPDSRILFLPRVGLTLSGSNIVGYGVAASAIYQRAINERISWYGGIGSLIGFKDFGKEANANNQEKRPMGVGLLGNIGFGWLFSDHFRVNCELSPVLQLNNFDENSQFVISPSIGVGYTISN